MPVPRSSRRRKPASERRVGCERGGARAVGSARQRASEHVRALRSGADRPILPPMTRCVPPCPKLKGNQLIGVINSIGKRRDAKASPALAKMMYGADADVARAAAAALGSIGGVSSVKELQTALAKTTGMTRMAVADASLVCAERLLADGRARSGLGALRLPQCSRRAQARASGGDERNHSRGNVARPVRGSGKAKQKSFYSFNTLSSYQGLSRSRLPSSNWNPACSFRSR